MENLQQTQLSKIDEFTVQTPGKIIISGEHSVVYQKPALVMAINLFTKSSVKIYKLQTTSQDAHQIELVINSAEKLIQNIKFQRLNDLELHQANIQNQEITKEEKLASFIALDILESQSTDLLDGKNFRILIDIESQIPIGAGLGSSAAYSIAYQVI